ncbi:MAG TPA: DNA-directed RNA polymerase subunit L [archaeon]|nr:DNA-directed RNA polymerase subunit L [archaeon]
MNIKVLLDEKEKLSVELGGDTQTVSQVIAKQVWAEGGEAAAVREHPFLLEPKIIVHGSNPRKLLQRAADAVAEQCDELEKEFKRALKE